MQDPRLAQRDPNVRDTYSIYDDPQVYTPTPTNRASRRRLARTERRTKA